MSVPDVGVPAGVTLGSDYQLKTLATMSAAQEATVMASIAGTGAVWIRVDYSDEPTAGVYSYKLDGMMAAATTAGLSVDAILSLPTWSRNASGTLNVSLVAGYMEQAAAHLASIGVHTYEILNEPNLNINPTTGISVLAYTQILKAMYPVIHRNDSSAMILAGGSALATSGGNQLSSIDYLTQMYADGAAGNFDALAIHPYIYPFLPEIPTVWNPWTFLPSIHALMVANGDGGKRIWYTEFGAPTSGTTEPVTPQVQALSYTQAFAMARSWSWSGPLFAFNWEDSADGDFGLHDSQGNPKPALAAFEQAAGGSTASAAAPASAADPTVTSKNNVVFTPQVSQTFSVQATGSPTPTVTETGTLPAGLTFSGDVIWGTPTPAAGGVYPLTFTAASGPSARVSQSFTLTVHAPPTVTSTNVAKFTVAAHGIVALAVTGTPTPTVTESGALPSGVQFAGGVLSGTPAVHTQGVYPLTFTASNGQLPNAVQRFQLTVQYGVPTLTTVAPALGPVTGGTAVTITGSNFTSASAVSFGTVAATRFNVSSPTQITAIAPPQGAGAHSIRVTTPGGTTALVTADTYTYPTSLPVITALAPRDGPAVGRNTVTITGTGFTSATAVRFGNVAASSFAVLSSTQIRAVAPAQTAGSHPVTVAGPGGTSAGGVAAAYVIDVPSVTKISPAAGPTSGHARVTITGSGFTGATAVQFGAVAALSFTVISPTQISAVSPSQASGAHNIKVRSAGGTSISAAGSVYTYR